MKCIIAGGRYYSLTKEDFDFLDTLGITEVVCGDASGADAGGARWAEERGIPVAHFPANWSKHGRSAGPIRNEEMAKYCQESVVLFPGGKGTDSMRQIATSYGLKIITPPTKEVCDVS